MRHQLGPKHRQFAHPPVLPPPHPDQCCKPLHHRPGIGLGHLHPLRRGKLQPHECVVRDDIGKLFPTRAPRRVHRIKPIARCHCAREGQVLPEPRIGPNHPGPRRRNHRRRPGIGRHRAVQRRRQRRQHPRRQHAIRVKPGARRTRCRRTPGVQRKGFRPLHKLYHPQRPTLRHLPRKSPRHFRGAVEATIGHHDHLHPPRHRARRHDGCKARSDPGCFVRRRDDQAQHPWHPLARASQRGFSSPRCRSAPQLPHLFGR